MDKRLKKHKYLEKYVKSFIKNDGLSEDGHYLPYLVIWCRKMFEACDISDSTLPDVLGWDNDMAEEFWSWGHNSRWNHVFRTWLEGDVRGSVSELLDIMDTAGQSDFDCDVETLIEREKENENNNKNYA